MKLRFPYAAWQLSLSATAREAHGPQQRPTAAKINEYNFKIIIKSLFKKKKQNEKHSACTLSCSVVSDSFQTLWTAACHAPPTMGFSSQKYWSGLPFPSPGDLPNLGMEPVSPALAGRFFTTEPPRKPQKEEI